MDLSQLTGLQISERLVGLIYHLRGRLHRGEADVLEEAAKWMRRHEALVSGVPTSWGLRPQGPKGSAMVGRGQETATSPLPRMQISRGTNPAQPRRNSSQGMGPLFVR
jgi:hypothetical protein